MNKKPLILILSALPLAGCMTMAENGSDTGMAMSAPADTVTVGGAPMYANRNIVANAVNSADPHHPGRGGQGCRAGRHPHGRRPVHRLRADQCRLRQAAGGHGRHPAQARE